MLQYNLRRKYAVTSFIICAVKVMKLTRTWKIINAYRISVGKPERKRQTERQKCKYDDNLKIGMVGGELL
jgi:hypothetical protein